MRFAMTAKTIARNRAEGNENLNEITAMNIMKVTRFRKGGDSELEKEIQRLERLQLSNKEESQVD